MTEEQKLEAEEFKFVLCCNLSLCHLKRNAPADAITYGKKAVEIKPESSKAHFRLYKAYRLSNDLDNAKETLKKALQLEPNNLEIRSEYQELCNTKSAKEKEWYSKMSGFLDSEKMRKIEKKDEQQKEMLHKIRRKHYERE